MIDASWSSLGGADCIRVRGLARGVRPRVLPATAAATVAAGSMAGRLVVDGADMCFLPRFGFVAGTTYTVTTDGLTTNTVTTNTVTTDGVTTDGDAAVRLVRPRPDAAAITEVLAIYPTATEVPRNLLRFSVWFSARMSEGRAAAHIRLLDEVGGVIAGALLPTEYELWDTERRRLTVLLDPARIKRGLEAHRQEGYPLRSGAAVRLVVDQHMHDARGNGLRAAAERTYLVGADERRHVEPHAWTLTAPPRQTLEPLTIAFDRPLDHGLLTRCLRAVGPDGRTVGGTADIGPGERSWRLTPRREWVPGSHRLLVDPDLEDLAGNSVARVFDRDLTRSADAPRPPISVMLPFQPE